jgi:hypothetical protein
MYSNSGRGLVNPPMDPNADVLIRASTSAALMGNAVNGSIIVRRGSVAKVTAASRPLGPVPRSMSARSLFRRGAVTLKLASAQPKSASSVNTLLPGPRDMMSANTPGVCTNCGSRPVAVAAARGEVKPLRLTAAVRLREYEKVVVKGVTEIAEVAVPVESAAAGGGV